MEESDVIGGVKAQKLAARYVPGKTADESQCFTGHLPVQEELQVFEDFFVFFFCASSSFLRPSSVLKSPHQ